MKVAENERKVMAILINHPRTTGAWQDPIQAVAITMRWITADSFKFVTDMFERHLLRIRTKARNLLDPADAENHWWEKGEKADKNAATIKGAGPILRPERSKYRSKKSA